MNNDQVTAKLLVSFANVEASKHYFYSSSIVGGEVSHLCTLPGCDNGDSNKTCYVSDVVNGVVCFSNRKDVYVLNPATSDILTLPRSVGYDKLSLSNNVNLSYSAYAFGFDPSKQEYKVLHVFGVPQCPGSALLQNHQCEIFTVRIKKSFTEKQKEVKEEKPKIVKKEIKIEGRKHKGDKKEEEKEEEEDEGDVWRKAVSLPPCPYMFRGQGVFVNGSIYWLSVSSPGEDAIVCFDVASEMFRSIPIPFILPYRSSLSHVRGRLAIQGIEKETGSTPTLGVWILEDIMESKWSKNTVGIVDPKEQKGVKFHVLVGDDSTGDMVVMRSVLPERYEVVCLSGNKNTAAERTITLGGLPDLQRGNNKINNFRIDNYVESTVVLDSIIIKVKKEEKEPNKVKEGRRKTYYHGHGQARNAQTKQFSWATQRTHDSHSQQPRDGKARGVQNQQFSWATQFVQRKHYGARGAQTQQQQRPQTSQYVQRSHAGAAQSHPMTHGAQAAQQPSQKIPLNVGTQPPPPPPPPSPASQPSQGTIHYGRAQPHPTKNHGSQPTYIRIGEINVQVS